MGGIVYNTLDTGMPRAMGAAVDITLLALRSVPEDAATAFATARRERMGGAFEGIEMVGRSVHRDLE